MVTPDLANLKVKLFLDAANLSVISVYKDDPLIQGFTTNPSLLRDQEIQNYEKFARMVLANVGNKPVSFEVLADKSDEMVRQAKIISSWGKNVYVKIPVTDTAGRFMGGVIKALSDDGIQLNVTAIMTMQQVENVFDVLNPDVQSIVSVFAGRIADTGRDPSDLMYAASGLLAGEKTCLLWASCREVLNIFQADDAGCDIITVPPAILAKLPLVGRNLDDYSRETVWQFYRDAKGLYL